MYDYSYYDYGTTYDYGTELAGAAAGAAAGLAIFAIIMWVIAMAISVFTIVCMWKLFVKAGKPGWAAIVPIYNIVVMLEITELPMWYIALFFVPFANIYAMFKIYIEFAKKFGKSAGFGVGMVFFAPIFLGILAFGKNSNYVGSQSVVQPAQPVQQQPAQPVQSNVQQNPSSSFCTGCGNQVVPGTKFCTRCGKQL